MAVQNESCHSSFFTDKITKLTGRKTLGVRNHLDFWMTFNNTSHDIFKIKLGWHVLSVINVRDMNNLYRRTQNFIGDSLSKSDVLNALPVNSAFHVTLYFYYR